MPIAFSCPECDKPLRVKDELAGRKIKCPGCASAVAVPESDEGAAITKAPARKKVEALTARKPVKKSARVVDDDDEDDEAPRGKHGARKSRRKAGAASSSLYLYLGISAGVVVALAVTLTIIFWPKKEDKSDAPSKDTPKDRQQVIANNNIPKPPERPIQVGLGESKPEVYKRLLKSAAWIQLSTGSLGSGALIDRQEQLVVTNFHVAGSVSSVTVYFPYYQDKAAQLAGKPNTDPRWYMDPKNSALASVHANVVWKDAKRDLALVQLGSVPPDIAAVPLLGRSAKIGEHVHSVGSSGINDGGMWRYTWGAVRNVYKAEKMFPSGPVNCQWIETNAPTNHGDSGGPIVNDKGQLVGLVQGGVNADPADRERVVSFNVDVSEIHHILGEYYKSKGKTYELPKLDDIDPSDVLAISKKLEDPDPSVRLQAIRAIAEFGPEARPFIRPLVKVWDDSNPTLRSAATKALEQIGPPPAEEASLLFDLVSSPVVEKKRYAAEVLATPNLVKRDQALPALLTLAKDGDAETRRKAVLGLGSVGTVNRKEAGATLAQCLGDQDASVRASAAAALGKLAPAVKAEAFARLLETLGDDDATVVQACSNALACMGDAAEADLPLLLKTLQGTKAVQRAVALEFMAKLGPKAKEALPQLPACFKDADMRVRLAAIALAGALGSDAKGLVPQLGKLLGETIKAEESDDSKIPTETVGDARMRALLLRSTCMIMWQSQEGLKLPESGFVVHVGERLVLTTYTSVGKHQNVFVFFPSKDRGNLITQARAYLDNVNLVAIPGAVVATNPKANLALVKLARLPAGIEALPLAPKPPDAGAKIATLAAVGIDVSNRSGELWHLNSGQLKDTVPLKVPGVDARFILIDGILSDYDSGYPIMEEKDGSVVGVGIVGREFTLPDKTTAKVTIAVDVRDIRPLLEEYFIKIGGNFNDSATRSGLGNQTQSTFRIAIAKALAEIGPDAAPAVKALAKALKDTSFGVRRQAATALGAIGKPAVETVAELLQTAKGDDKPEVIEEATARLGKDAVPALLKALKGTEVDMLKVAIHVAGRIGPPAKDAVPQLTIIATRPGYGQELPKLAAEAIEKINKR